jgi:hypothetical protein
MIDVLIRNPHFMIERSINDDFLFEWFQLKNLLEKNSVKYENKDDFILLSIPENLQNEFFRLQYIQKMFLKNKNINKNKIVISGENLENMKNEISTFLEKQKIQQKKIKFFKSNDFELVIIHCENSVENDRVFFDLNNIIEKNENNKIEAIEKIRKTRKTTKKENTENSKKERKVKRKIKFNTKTS